MHTKIGDGSRTVKDFSVDFGDDHIYIGGKAYPKGYFANSILNITKEEMELGHGGMDYLVVKAFLNAILNDEEMPIDVYDMAAWMAITPLSEQSIAHGGMPQAIPDFTRGRWILREPKDVLDLPKVETKSGDDKNEFGYSRK